MKTTTSNKKITIIGNNNDGAAVSDGGRIKIRLYKSLLEDEGFNVEVIDLNNWKSRFLSIIRKIRKAIRNSESIIIMAGPNGSRLIIPLVYKLNKNKHTRVVFCPVGIGTIDKVVRDLPPNKLTAFLSSIDFGGKKDNRFSKYLSSFNSVILENRVLENCYKSFYNLKNTDVLTNFRVFNETGMIKRPQNSDDLRCIFLSRVCEEKGILDLVNCVNDINRKERKKIYLDIFGDIQLKNKNNLLEKTNMYVRYRGVIDQKESYNILSKYDLFILPTKYHGEGTPGALVESLIAGTPVLVSNYSQSKELIVDDFNGYQFEMDSTESLSTKLLSILNNKNKLIELSSNAVESSKKFVYKYVKEDFLRLIGGVVK